MVVLRNTQTTACMQDTSRKIVKRRRDIIVVKCCMILNNDLDNHETDLVLSRDNKPRGTKRQQRDGQADQETTRSSNEKTKHNTHLHSLQRRQLCELTWIRKEESNSALLEARGVAAALEGE